MSTDTRLATLEELKVWVRTATGNEHHDESLALALDAASAKVQDHCDRLFVRDDTAVSPTANARTYRADSPYRLYVRDFYDTTGLTVKTDTTDDGTYDTTWTVTTDFVVGPSDQRAGYPWYRIEAVGSRTFPCAGRRARVEVTALYGWDVVPDMVKNVTLDLAAFYWKRRDAIGGEIGFEGFSSPGVGPSPNMFLSRLHEYKRHPVLVR